MEVWVQECGIGEGRTSSKINIRYNDFALLVGNKRWRFEVDGEGNLVLPLINGADCRITQYSTYPAIKLIND